MNTNTQTENSWPRNIKVAVLATDSSGSPTFVTTEIQVTEEEYDNGAHYQRAKDYAYELEYEGPMFAFDSNDYASRQFSEMASFFELNQASEVVASPSTTQAEPEKTITVVVGAYGTSDNGDAPSYAAFEVTQALLAKLAKLIEFCNEHELTEARVAGYPNWGPGDIEDDLRLQNGEMVVLPGGSFWFTDHPRYGGYHIQSRGSDIAALQAAFDSSAHGEVIFLTNDQEVRAQYEADNEEAEADGWLIEKG